MTEKELEKQKQKEDDRMSMIMDSYKEDQRDKVKFIGGDTKDYFLYNPYNEKLVQEACENSGLDIELKAYSDVIVVDCFHKKAKDYISKIKKVAGRDLTNPLFKDKRLIITVNGDSYNGLKDTLKKYYLLKELTRVLYNYEKDTYRILKYNYQNNYVLINKFGLEPTADIKL